MEFKELHILTRDLHLTKEFYYKKLGFPVVHEDAGKIGFNLKGSVLYFNKTAIDTPVYHIAFKAPPHTIPAAIKWLQGKAEQIPVDQGQLLADFKNWNAESTYFFDPNGNIMEVIDRQTGSETVKQPFTASLITGICEVGIVTPNVRETCHSLSREFGLDYYKRQPPAEHFAAVGDDDGLFIVVSKNRNWFPTQITSSVHRLEIKFKINGREFFMSHP